MFNFNIFNTPESLKMFLCKPDKTILYELNAIDESTAGLSIKLNNQSELSFDYWRYINSIYNNNNNDDDKIESNGYYDLSEGMKIFVDKIGFFKISEVISSFDLNLDKKSITAISNDCELMDKDLTSFKINTGEPDSLEYLVKYKEGEEESLINEYTGLPYDYIVFYNTFSNQLNNLLNKYSDGEYTDVNIINEIKEYCNLIPRLQSKIINEEGSLSIEQFVIFTYDEGDNNNIIKVELINFNERIDTLITFYTNYRSQLSLLDLAIEKCNCNWKIGIVDESLCNKKYQFNIDETNIYSFLTTDLSNNANCIFEFDLFTNTINVILVENIGVNSGVLLNRNGLLDTLEITSDENSLATRFNVSGGENLNISYVNFGDSRIDDISYFLNARNEKGKRIYLSDNIVEKYEQFLSDREIVREWYINTTIDYNQTLINIDELKYRLPNDSMQNDWDSFTDTELNGMLTTYNNLLVSLETLYKEDYGSNGCNIDGSINEDYIKTTEYWYDYYAYKQTIEQIEEAIYYRTLDIRYANIEDENVLEIINAYKTEWSLYGSIELNNKIIAYDNQLKVLVDGEAVEIDNLGVAKSWEDLTDNEKLEYGNLSLNYYKEVYDKIYNEREECQAYLNDINSQIDNLNIHLNQLSLIREEVVKLIQLRNYDRESLNKIVPLPSSSIEGSFTIKEIGLIESLYIDKNYTNENIIKTSLNDIVTEIENQKELLNEAKNQLSIECQPQYKFTATIGNLLGLKEFQNYQFYIGNYVLLEYYEKYYVKLRLSSIVFNPCNPYETVEISFTNYITSKIEKNDFIDILNLSVNNGVSSTNVGNNSSDSIFGETDKIDVTISNTMLAKLLNSEMFNSKVSNVILDTIKSNEITAKFAKFGGLAKGTTIIDGRCITTGYIVDSLYNGTSGDIDNTEGSIINLDDGKFNLASGNLIYDGNNLSIKGDGNNITNINGNNITTGLISAERLDVTGIFAKNITATGTITGANLIGSSGTFIKNFNVTIPYDVNGHVTNISEDVDFYTQIYTYSNVIRVGATNVNNDYVGTDSFIGFYRNNTWLYSYKTYFDSKTNILFRVNKLQSPSETDIDDYVQYNMNSENITMSYSGNNRLVLSKEGIRLTATDFHPYLDFSHMINISNANYSRIQVTSVGRFEFKTIDSSGISSYSTLLAGAYNNASSKVIKENIRNMTKEEANKILYIPVYSFDYKKGWGKKNQYGVIAEEVNSIIPSVVDIPVNWDENNNLLSNDINSVPSVDYSKFVPYLIKQIQILKEELDLLKNKKER